MLKYAIPAALVAAASCTTAADHAPAAATACEVSATDRAWIDRALAAWRFSKREITSITATGDLRAIFFDGDCVLASPNALTDEDGLGVTWTAMSHAGTVTLPNGDEIPAGVTSFTTGAEGHSYFVMSTPSLWSAGGVRGDPLDLETMMTFVVLHEASHVVQASTYGRRIGALAERHNLPESFNDDSMQHRFGETDAFAASIRSEIDLFLQAASAPDRGAALRLAREARALMRDRAARFFVGEDAYFAETEAVWLTFEGSGQWAGYRWLIHPEGMGLSPDLARRAAMRSRWWSQNEGLAIALVLDRLGPANWHEVAFGDGNRTLLEMLDEALMDE
jgi:hypothetical protein